MKKVVFTIATYFVIGFALLLINCRFIIPDTRLGICMEDLMGSALFWPVFIVLLLVRHITVFVIVLLIVLLGLWLLYRMGMMRRRPKNDD